MLRRVRSIGRFWLRLEHRGHRVASDLLDLLDLPDLPDQPDLLDLLD